MSSSYSLYRLRALSTAPRSAFRTRPLHSSRSQYRRAGARSYASTPNAPQGSNNTWLAISGVAVLGAAVYFLRSPSKTIENPVKRQSDVAKDDSSPQTSDGGIETAFKGLGKNVENDVRKHEETAKGPRRRIDSALRTPQGHAGDESQIRDSQRGISNAPTMHSTDQMANPNQSKKPEGVPDTAKLPGIVDPARPAK